MILLDTRDILGITEEPMKCNVLLEHRTTKQRVAGILTDERQDPLDHGPATLIGGQLVRGCEWNLIGNPIVLRP